MAAYDVDELLSDSPVATRSQKHVNRLRCCRRRLSSPGISDHGVNLPDVLALLPVNHILAFTSVGSLQVLSMTSKTWLKQAYSGASPVEVDMKDWPFSVTELKRERARGQGNLWIDHLDFDHLDFDLTPGNMEGLSLKKTSLPDSRVANSDLNLALRNFKPPQLRKLVASSSSLTSASVSWALDTFASGIQEVALSSCGSGRLGVEIQESLEKCQGLLSLHLEHVKLTPPKSAKLQELIVGDGVMSQLWPPTYFQHVQSLNFAPQSVSVGSDEEVHNWFLEIFKRGKQLKVINIYYATEVTNGMLAVLMQHVPHLQQFCGCHTRPLWSLQPVDFPFSSGPEAVQAGALSPLAVEAFKGRFADAKIFIDDVYGEALEDDYDADDWLGLLGYDSD